MRVGHNFMSWLFAFSLKFIFKSVNLGQENGRSGGVRQWGLVGGAADCQKQSGCRRNAWQYQRAYLHAKQELCAGLGYR